MFQASYLSPLEADTACDEIQVVDVYNKKKLKSPTWIYRYRTAADYTKFGFGKWNQERFLILP